MAINVAAVSRRRAAATVFSVHKPLSQSQVAIDFNKLLYAQKRNADLDAAIDSIWREKTAANSHYFNGSKFRMEKCVTREDGKLELQLGLTCYKDLCGTTLSDRVDDYMEAGIRDHRDCYSYLSQALGVGMLLLTSDRQLVLLRRAKWTGEAPGCWDRPGGHAEPNAVEGLGPNCLQDSAEDETGTKGRRKALEEAILKEVWESTANEAVDEVGVPSPTGIKLIGVSCGADAGDRQSLEFIARVPQTGTEVKAAYETGKHAEADESTALLLLPLADVTALMGLLCQRYTVTTTSDPKGVGVPTFIEGKSPPEKDVAPPAQQVAGERKEKDGEGDSSEEKGAVRNKDVSRPDGEEGRLPAAALEEIANNCATALVGALLMARPTLAEGWDC